MKPTRRQILKALSIGGLSPLFTPLLERVRAEGDDTKAALPRRFLFVVKSSGLTPAELVPKDLVTLSGP